MNIGLGIGLPFNSHPLIDAFYPKSLFSAGEQGAWYDPSDITTMFQDSAGTTPVTAVEQPVGLILDKSGRNNHAFQTTTTKRPIYRQDAFGKYHLSFDGVDDALVTNSINFTLTDKMTVWAGVRKLSDANQSMIVELNTGTSVGIFWLSSLSTSVYAFSSSLSGPRQQANTRNFLAPVTSVLTGTGAATTCELRVNGVQEATNSSSQGTGNYGNFPLFIGQRNQTSLPFNGNIYSLIVRGAQSSAAQIASTEQYVNGKTGAY